ncbi:MAG: hypothetical protein JWL83_506 [Actinomycetia bacterium]|jgi:hypothetical protein|nr:hypothetical protein [Actinomycetes bacterium]
MYLFSRRRRAAPGQIPEAMGWAVETAAKASQIAGLPVTAWSSMWGADAGTITWTVFAIDLVGIEQAGDKLATDAGFSDRVREAETLFSGPVEDQLAQVLHGAPQDAPSEYVSVVTAELAPGAFRTGVEAAIEIASAADRITGRPTMVSMAMTGRYGGIAWLTGHPDVAALDAAQNATNADGAFVALVDRVSTYYQPDAVQAIYRRLI